MPATLIWLVATTIFYFVLQLLFCFGAKRKRGRRVPVWLLCILAVTVLVFWLAGLGGYDWGNILSIREAQSLFGAILWLAALVGDILAWAVYRSTRWHT